MNGLNFALVCVLCLVLNGCIVQSPRPDDPYYAPVIPSESSLRPISNGSLFNEREAMDLFGDSRARRVGDILTIRLQENTVSSKSSNVDITKDSEINIPEVTGAVGTVLGGSVSYKGTSIRTDLEAEREFNGAADAAQSNNLRGNVSVTVVDILPNGTLVVRGEKWLTLNRGDEFIRLSGLVRPADIGPDNTVVSTKVANARITYAGKGTLAESQNMGWLAKFFNSVYWPF